MMFPSFSLARTNEGESSRVAAREQLRNLPFPKLRQLLINRLGPDFLPNYAQDALLTRAAAQAEAIETRNGNSGQPQKRHKDSFSKEFEKQYQNAMKTPFTEDEVQSLAESLYKFVLPETIYLAEARRENDRIRCHAPDPKRLVFQGRKGIRRRGVLVRHNIKRRWQKLGVWNPHWGFPGRKRRPGDDASRWTWSWQAPDQALSKESERREAIDLVKRALHLRQGKGPETVPVIPRSRVRENTTPSQAESFLISRPWFLWQVALKEQNLRFKRIQHLKPPKDVVRKTLVDMWKKRGDWRNTSAGENPVDTSWKWRHETPSPEPEDLRPVENMQDNPLEATDKMEYTPSEIDELETIDLPRSKQPEGFWTIEEGDDPPYFPGQTIVDMRGEEEEEEQSEDNRGAAFRHPMQLFSNALMSNMPSDLARGLFQSPMLSERLNGEPGSARENGEANDTGRIAYERFRHAILNDLPGQTFPFYNQSRYESGEEQVDSNSPAANSNQNGNEGCNITESRTIQSSERVVNEIVRTRSGPNTTTNQESNRIPEENEDAVTSQAEETITDQTPHRGANTNSSKQDQPPPSPPRRSTRLAASAKRTATDSLSSSKPRPNKRPRRGTATATVTSTPEPTPTRPRRACTKRTVVEPSEPRQNKRPRRGVVATPAPAPARTRAASAAKKEGSRLMERGGMGRGRK